MADMKKYRITQFIVPTILLMFFICLFYEWTLNFTSFTTYAYVLNSAGILPRKSPQFKIVDQYGQQLNTSDLFKKKYVLLNFMYFRCPYVCSTIIAKLTNIHNHLNDGLAKNIMMVSISIDPKRDTPDMLRQVWNVHGSPKEWIFVSLTSDVTAILSDHLRQFGIWIYQRPNGIFNHSTYLFFLDPSGNIVHVFNAEESDDKIIQTMEQIVS